jgi:hypothetical protein
MAKTGKIPSVKCNLKVGFSVVIKLLVGIICDCHKGTRKINCYIGEMLIELMVCKKIYLVFLDFKAHENCKTLRIYGALYKMHNETKKITLK